MKPITGTLISVSRDKSKSSKDFARVVIDTTERLCFDVAVVQRAGELISTRVVANVKTWKDTEVVTAIGTTAEEVAAMHRLQSRARVRQRFQIAMTTWATKRYGEGWWRRDGIDDEFGAWLEKRALREE